LVNSNNAVGFAALASNTTILQNQAMGVVALGLKVDGGAKVPIRDTALSPNEHGDYNTVVGWKAENARRSYR
jgi:hypothetical protein